MDLESMNRKDLQALCKKHGIPANTKNSQMIESLSSILQEKVKPKGCLKGSGGSSAEDLGVFRGGSKKVTFVVEDVEEDGDEGFVVNPLGKSKRKSVGRRSGAAAKLENSSGSESPKDAIEVLQRITRTRGLAEAVLWSPGIEKKKMKKSGDDTVGVRQNAKEKKRISVAVPTTRSLRNRVVTVGGDEEAVTDQNPRRTRMTKDSVKEEENEKVVALEEDEAVGRRNLRKRSRDVESVEDELPRRRSTRSHVKLEEAEAVEEVDVGRSRKRRRRGLEVSVVEKVVDEVTEWVSKPGGNSKRLRGNALGDASDSEAVATSTRRSTRSSSALLEDGNFAAAVGKSDQEGDAVRKGKSQKQAKACASKGGDSVSLLIDNEVLDEPIKRSTRSSSTLPEDGTSLPAVVKSVKGGVAVKKGKSLKQDNSSKGGNPTTSLPDREAIAMPIRRSTRSSSSLLENGTSISVVGKSVEEGVVVITPTRRSTRSSSKPLEDEKPNEAVTSPTRRSSRSSSKLLEVEMSNNEAVTSPTRRTTHSSSKLMEDEMTNNEAVSLSTRKSARSSSKLSEVEMPKNEAVTSHTKRATRSIPTRRLTCSSSKQGDSTAPLQYSEAVTPARRLRHGSSKLVADEIPSTEVVTASTRRSTRSSLKLLEDEILDNGSVATLTRRSTSSSSKMLAAEASLPVVCKLDVQSDAVRNDDSVKQPKGHTSKQVDSTASLSNNDAAITPTRRSTCSSSKLLEDMTPTNKAAAQTEALEVYEQHDLPRGSTRSASKHDESCVSAVSLNVSDDILGTNKKKKRTREAASEEDAFVMERETIGGSGSGGTLQVSSTSSRRKGLRDVTADCDVVQQQCSPHSSRFLEGDANVSEMHQSPVNVQLQMDESGTSLVGTPKDLEGVCFGSDIREKQSSQEMENMGRDLLSLNLIEDSLDIQENVSGEPMGSNIDVTVEAEGPSELYGDVTSKVLAPVEFTSSTVKASSRGTSVGALDDVVGIAGVESQNITPPPLPLKSSEELPTTFLTENFTVAQFKEPDSAVEVVEREDMVTGYEEARVSSPQLPCKSSAELSLTSNTEVSLGIHLEGPNSQGENHDSTEDALEGNEATDIRESTFVRKSSELLSPSFNSDASPVTDLKEPDSNVEVECPSEDVSTDSGATKIFVPMTSNTEICPNAFCDINAEEFDAEVEVHVTSKGGMEGTDDKNIAGSPLSYRSTGVSSPILLNEVSPGIDLGESVLKVSSHDMNKVASHSNDFLDEASDNHSKTLKTSLTADWDALYLSDIQRMFDNETENCTTDQNSTLNAQSSPEECDVGKKVESPPGNSDSPSCEVGLEVVKETWVSSTLSVTVSEGIGTEEDKIYAETNGDEGRPSSSGENPAFDLCVGDLMKEHETQPSKEIVDQATVLSSHGDAKQLEDRLHDADLKSTRFSASANDNRSPISLCYEGSTKQVGIQDFPCVPDREDSRHLSDQQEVTVYVTESLDVESTDRSPKSTPEAHDSVKPLNVVADILSEAADTANEHTDIEFDRNHELGSLVAEETGNLESLESDASIEGGDDIVMMKVDNIGRHKFDHVEIGRQQDETYLHETKVLSGEHHHDDIASHPPVENSASMPEQTLLSLENFDSSTHRENESNDEKEIGAERESGLPCNIHEGSIAAVGESNEEERAHVSPIKSESTQEATMIGEQHAPPSTSDTTPPGALNCKEVELCKESSFGGANSVDIRDEESIDEKEIRAKRELKLLCNIREGSIAAMGESNEEERAHVSPIKSESPTEATMIGEQHTTPSTSVTTPPGALNCNDYHFLTIFKSESTMEATMIGEQHTTPSTSVTTPPGALNCNEVGLCKESSFGGAISVDLRGEESNDEKEIEAKKESRLLCNIHEGSIAAMGESNEEERAHVSPIKSESTPEATMIGEQHTTPSASVTTPPAALNCNELGLCKESSFGGANSVDIHDEDNDMKGVYITNNDNVELKESSDLNTIIASSKSTEVEHGVDQRINVPCGMTQESSFGGANSVDIRDEDNDMKGVYITNNDNVELKESSDLNTLIASSKSAEVEHGVDQCINMPCGMTQDSEGRGISENNEASPAADASPKSHTQDEESNRYQGELESFVQASSVEATWAAPGATLMFVEELFHMDSKVATSVNDSVSVGQLEQHGEILVHGKCGNFLEETEATQEGEMKALSVSESSVAKIEEAGPYECGMSSENFSGGSTKPCEGVDSQATRSAEQSEGQEGKRVFSQEALEVSKDNMFARLDGGKIEGSAMLEPKFEENEITPSPRVAKQELIAKNFTELSVTNVADQVSWDHNKSVESRSVGNELEDSKFRETVTAQHALVSPDAGAARDSSTAMQEESIVSRDEIIAPEEYFEDFGWSFSDTFDVDSSHQEVQAVDSQLPMESRIGNSAGHPSKSGIDVNQEQCNISELDQIEEGKECVQSTPMQIVRTLKPYSIDDVIKNKENTVGLKMDSTRKHNDRSAISNSSRRPLQSVRKDKDEH